MNTDMNGKRIKKIFWEIDGSLLSLEDAIDGSLTLSATYHGDHDEFWVKMEDEKGKEIARHNCRYIATIEWRD